MSRRVAVTFIMGLDCIVDVDQPGQAPELEEGPAPIFAIETPAGARAGERFSLNAWVYLDGVEPTEVLASSFTATVDDQARTITVTGRVRKLHPDAGRHGQPRIQRALVVGIGAVAGAGDWEVRVPAIYRAASPELPVGMGCDVPLPGSSWMLRID